MAIIAVIVAAVVVVAAVGLYYAIGNGDGGTSMPEGAVDGFVDEMVDGDVEAALQYTDISFLPEDEYDEAVEGMEGSIEDDELEIIDIKRLSASELDAESEEMLEWAESDYEAALEEAIGEDVEVTGFAIVEVTYEENGEELTTEMLCVEINGRWYLSYLAMGYMEGGEGAPVVGALTYIAARSYPLSGVAVFELTLTSPSLPLAYEVHPTLYDVLGNQRTSVVQWNWTHESNDYEHLQTGDMLRVDVQGSDISGWEVVMTVSGYSGTITGSVPYPENPETKYLMIGTSLGVIRVELDTANAPVTTAHIISLVNSDYYLGTGKFYRAEPGFVIQGGTQTPSTQTVAWEDTGLANAQYTIAMARSGDPDSAADSGTGSSEFFINLNSNTNLDSYVYPYVVFGTVVEGQSIVNQIAGLPTTSSGGIMMLDDPVEITYIAITDEW
jgi:cyclophilin family peptidyl-prolyl cis-trans isomerase